MARQLSAASEIEYLRYPSWCLCRLLDKQLGAKEEVHLRRKCFLMDNYVCKENTKHKILLSGSIGEGVTTLASDLDVMKIDRHTKVFESVYNTPSDASKTSLLMERGGCNPGFAILRLIGKSNSPSIKEATVEFHGHSVVSSLLYRDVHRQADIGQVGHGPCNTNDLCGMDVDVAHCFECKLWPTEAHEFIYRRRLHGWPQKSLLDKIFLTSESYRCPSQLQNQSSTLAIHNGSCFQYVRRLVSWDTANANCTANRGHLTVLSSRAVNDFLSQMLQNLENFPTTVWIGANDVIVEGDWVWVNGASWGFTKWASGFPTYCFSSRCQEDCAYQKPTTGEWEDAKCTETKPYVCQYAAITTNMTSTITTARITTGQTTTATTTNTTTVGIPTVTVVKETVSVLKDGVLIAIVGLLFIFLLIIITVVLVWRRRRLKKKKTNQEVPVRFENSSYMGIDMSDVNPYNTLTRSEDEHLYRTIGAVGEDPEYDSIPADKLKDLDSDYLTPT